MTHGPEPICCRSGESRCDGVAAPVHAGVLLGGSLGEIVGLWTTSFLLGFVAAAGARILTVILEREVSLGMDYFWEGLQNATWMGPVLGLGTFVAPFLAITLLSVPGTDVIGLGLSLIGLYILTA